MIVAYLGFVKVRRLESSEERLAIKAIPNNAANPIEIISN
jgi:hypothetical protein